jgi:hypothetical protein
MQDLVRGMLVKKAAARERAHRMKALSSAHTWAIGIRAALALNSGVAHSELTQAADMMLRFVRQHCLKNQCSKRDGCTSNAKKLVAANMMLRFACRHCLKGQCKRIAVDAMLRFARRHCLKSQHRKEDRCTGNAKKLIRQLTAAMRGEHERAQDQLLWKCAQRRPPSLRRKQPEYGDYYTLKTSYKVWDYIPCYLVKHVGDREVYTFTCANAGCKESRYDKPCRKHPSERRLFCSRVCKDEVCTATGLAVKELR